MGITKYSITVENLLEILKKRGNQTFYKPIDVHSATNNVGNNVFLQQQCGILWIFLWVGNKYLKDRKRFSNQIKRNCFDPILAGCDWHCSTI